MQSSMECIMPGSCIFILLKNVSRSKHFGYRVLFFFKHSPSSILGQLSFFSLLGPVGKGAALLFLWKDFQSFFFILGKVLGRRSCYLIYSSCLSSLNPTAESWVLLVEQQLTGGERHAPFWGCRGLLIWPRTKPTGVLRQTAETVGKGFII